MTTPAKTTGLRYWMLRVLSDCEHVSADFSADPVHDLRVALRRCRSMADGMMAMDPDPAWQAMKKAGKRLFQRLGDLRDVQIMMEWVEKLELEKLQGEQAHAVLASVERALLPALPAEEHRPPTSTEADPSDTPHHHHPAHALLHIL
ncbi:MAG TPA: CHAD domain-containing protein, partial [Candidatus Acidoferrales bacterium]|nr:CHAD domain-containing protein [Candidatus Acidoferrales bacterium]